MSIPSRTDNTAATAAESVLSQCCQDDMAIVQGRYRVMVMVTLWSLARPPSRCWPWRFLSLSVGIQLALSR
jgi:hypothetical protein